MEPDYYKILGVPRTATSDEIKKAYREKAKQYHPDVSSGRDAQMQALNLAYGVLGNDTKRKAYDAQHFRPSATNHSGFKKQATTCPVSDVVQDILRRSGLVKDPAQLVEENKRAYDSFVRFFEFMNQEAKALDKNFSFNYYKAYTDPANRGNVPANTYYEVEREIRQRMAICKENIRAYDHYMQYLASIESKAKEYGLSLDAYKNVRRGPTATETFLNNRNKLQEQLAVIEERALAFDRFTAFYQRREPTMRNLYDMKLEGIERYLDSKNRLTIDPGIFANVQERVIDIMFQASEDRKRKLEQVKQQFSARHLDFREYLGKKEQSEMTISTSSLNTILGSFHLLDQINADLKPLGITLEDYLVRKKRSFFDVEHDQLLDMKKAIMSVKMSGPIKARDIFALDLLQPQQASKPSKRH